MNWHFELELNQLCKKMYSGSQLFKSDISNDYSYHFT